MRKKLLSLLLAALMVLGLLPAAALAAEGDAAPAVQAAEDVAVQADEETVDPPIVKVGDTAYDVTYVGVANSYGDQLYKVTVPSGTESVTLFWQAAADAGDALVCCPCSLIDNLNANTGTATFPLTGHGEREEAGAVSAEYCTEEQLASLKADGRSLSFAQFIYYAANGDVAGCAVIAIEVEADDSSDSNAITVTVDGTTYEVKDTGTVTADSKAAPIYKVVVPNGTAAVTGHWGMLVTRGSVACLCGACTVSLSELKASNGTFTLPLTGHSGEETAAVSKGYFATSEALQNIKEQSYQKMVFAWMRCKDADSKWCYALLCVEIEGVTNTAPALAAGVTLYTVVKPDGETYTTDVTKFFTDDDSDPLTYYVSVNGGEFEQLTDPANYTYTYGENFANARLTFKANDGKADSLQNCIVILNNPEYPVVNGADSSTTDTTTGTAVRLSIGTLITHPQSIGLNYFVSIDGGEYKQITLSDRYYYTYAPTKAGTHTLLFKASTAKTLDEGKTSGVYTWTVAATGADIDNHAPIVKNQPEGPGVLWAGRNAGGYWKPDLESIFSDPDGDTLTYSRSIDGGDFSEYYPSVGIHADYLKTDGTHTVTIRATDPYGEYAEFTVTIEKKTNHAPTKIPNTPNEIYVFVPVGLKYTVDANLYFTDEDEIDQGNLSFSDGRNQLRGFYEAKNAGDTADEEAIAADGGDYCRTDPMTIHYRAIDIDTEATITLGETYTIDPAALDGINIPGSYKVRVSNGTNGGAEQSFDSKFTFTPEMSGTYIVHIYGDKTTTAAENYVVKLTVEQSGAETAPMTVTIGETGYEVSYLTTADYEGTNYKIYKTVVPKDFDNLTITLKNAATVNEIYCVDYSAKKASSITIPNHEDCEDIACELGVNVADYIDTTKYGMINVITDDTSLHFLLLIQVGGTESETEFVPSIGNGTNTATPENNVTMFPAGTNANAPIVTVTAPADGWIVGDNTFTVACEKACVVLVKSGETYTKLTATNDGDTHSFTATLAEGDEIIVRLKGDVNGDGIVNALDATLVSRACLSTTHGAYKAFDALSTCAVGTPSALVAMQINRACLSETHAAYQAMTW